MKLNVQGKKAIYVSPWSIFFKIFIGIYMIYNVVLVLGVQQSESVIHMHISSSLFFRFFSHIGHYRVFFFFLNKFIYLILAALGFRCFVQAFSSCGQQGLLFVAVCGLFI